MSQTRDEEKCQKEGRKKQKTCYTQKNTRFGCHRPFIRKNINVKH